MTPIFIKSWGAVSPAGWGVPALRDAIAKGEPLPIQKLDRPGWSHPLSVRTVPPPNPRPAFLAHARLRRSSTISQVSVAAAVEALGPSGTAQPHGRLGIIVCVLSGCVNYSRRFYDEALKNPSTASPLLFPETVFNAPASHLAAYFGTTAINYTILGDSGAFLQGLALAATWINSDRADSVLVVGAEEMDWLTADALRLFKRGLCFSEGAGALLLTRNSGPLLLEKITDEHLFTSGGATRAIASMQAQLAPFGADDLLVDSEDPALKTTAPGPWRDWKGPRISPKAILGEGLMSSAACQCVVAADLLANSEARRTFVSVIGTHQHAIGAAFQKNSP